MEADKKNYFKFALALFFCLLVRLIPMRAPNIEPILATTMPVSRAYGAFLGFFFAILSILLYDIATSTLGAQTFFTTLAYGLVGLWSAVYFKEKKVDKWVYARFAIVGTLLYDALTGLTVGPIFFHQSFLDSLFLQIPFTALHLLGNITFAVLLSPIIYNFFKKQQEKKSAILITTLNPKTI